MYIIHIGKYYWFSKKELHGSLLHSHILSILVFGILVWGCASMCIRQVDKFSYINMDILYIKNRLLIY